MDFEKEEFNQRITAAAQKLMKETSVCRPDVELPYPLPPLDPKSVSYVDCTNDETFTFGDTAYVFPALHSDPYDTTMRDYWPDGNTSCVAGTMALEGMELSDNSIHNIERIKLGEDVYKILDEIKQKYREAEINEESGILPRAQ